ncbi:MAG: hypothetical protein JOZ05_07060 [Acetobacteraceae bacterium]|nr:hypothetical protein [Acetobacteraceae bacterium]
MALLEDMLKGNLLVAAAIGATALVLPKVLPDLSPSLRSAVRSGLSLLLESEAEAEGGIINRLAETALENVLKGLCGPGPAEDRHEAAQAAITDFKRTARSRARRYGRNQHDQSARYQRHVAALQGALKHARRRHGGAHAKVLDNLSTTLEHA